MPPLRVGRDLGVGEAAHLAADRLESVVEARVADRAFLAIGDEGGEGGPVLAGGAPGDQGVDGFGAKAGDVPGREAEVGKAGDFALVHGDAAEHLSEIFAEADPGQEPLGLAEAAFLPDALGVGAHFPDRFDVGRKPREAVGCALLGFELVRAEPAAFAHPVAHGVERAVQKALGGEVSLTGKMVERHRGRSPTAGAFCCAAACVGAGDVATHLLSGTGRNFGAAR